MVLIMQFINYFYSFSVAILGTVSQSSTNIIGNLQKLKQNDFNLYSSAFLPNDILKALDYFVVENKDAGKKKEAFSWGKVNLIYKIYS